MVDLKLFFERRKIVQAELDEIEASIRAARMQTFWDFHELFMQAKWIVDGQYDTMLLIYTRLVGDDAKALRLSLVSSGIVDSLDTLKEFYGSEDTILFSTDIPDVPAGRFYVYSSDESSVKFELEFCAGELPEWFTDLQFEDPTFSPLDKRIDAVISDLESTQIAADILAYIYTKIYNL